MKILDFGLAKLRSADAHIRAKGTAGGELADVGIRAPDTEASTILQSAIESTEPGTSTWYLSPDDRLLAYQSGASGRSDIYVVNFPDFTDRNVVSRDGGRHPLWDSKGKELFYLRASSSGHIGGQNAPALKFAPETPSIVKIN